VDTELSPPLKCRHTRCCRRRCRRCCRLRRQLLAPDRIRCSSSLASVCSLISTGTALRLPIREPFRCCDCRRYGAAAAAIVLLPAATPGACNHNAAVPPFLCCVISGLQRPQRTLQLLGACIPNVFHLWPSGVGGLQRQQRALCPGTLVPAIPTCGAVCIAAAAVFTAATLFCFI